MVRRFAFGWGVGSVAALCAVWCGSAQAETAAEILSTFNLVTEGNATTGSDIEGSTVVGGDLSGATFFGNNTPANPLLVIYGNLTDSISPTANKPQTVELTHSGQESSVHCNGPCTFISPPTSPLSDYTAPLNALSTQLSNLAPTPGAGIVDNSGNATFTVPAGTTGIAVIDITGTQLEADLQNSNVEFSIPNTVTGLIVNVDGSFLNPGGVNFNGVQQDALFNFYGSSSTDVTLGVWGASILAPFAAVTIDSNINGFVYADSFTSNGGEVHNYGYTGALPPTTVPEPSTWAMMLAGFAGLAYVGFRRSRKQPVAAF
jgi:choice-of-anchor A domain-containing protein